MEGVQPYVKYLRTTNLRLTTALFDAMQAKAKDQHISASELMRRSMSAFTTGAKSFTPHEPISKQTTFHCPYDLYDRFKELATEANVPMDEALRIAITTHLNENQSPHHIDPGEEKFNASLTLTSDRD